MMESLITNIEIRGKHLFLYTRIGENPLRWIVKFSALVEALKAAGIGCNLSDRKFQRKHINLSKSYVKVPVRQTNKVIKAAAPWTWYGKPCSHQVVLGGPKAAVN